MKKFFTTVFVVLGVIFFIQLIVLTYLFVIDPFNLKPVLFGSGSSVQTGTNTLGSKNPALNSAQEKALETFGINPEAVPSSISPEQEPCFVTMLGQARVNEIKAGGTPTATEFFQAKGCL